MGPPDEPLATTAYQKDRLGELLGVDGRDEIPLYLTSVGRTSDVAESSLLVRFPGCGRAAPLERSTLEDDRAFGPRSREHRMRKREQELPGRRINVVGTTGSGKTTVARAIAEHLGVQCVELDALFWRPNWGQTPDDDFLPAVDEATRGDRWVVDGNYSRTRPIVWPRADTIVWLDYRFPRVFSQLLWRTIRRSITKEELWGGCRERFRASFLSRDSILIWCLKTYWRRRRTYPELFSRPEYAHLRLIRLRSPCATRDWLQSLDR
jgi:adenylate kinase family enzyme